MPEWVHPSELADVPQGATGLFIMRRQDVLVRLDAKGQLQYNGFRARILNPKALELGNIAIAWNPAAGGAQVHAVKVYRGDEVIDVLKSARFEILRREDQLEASRIDGVLTAVLRVPDLRVGDDLEVNYTVRVADPTLGEKVSGLLVLGASPPAGRYRLGLSWEANHKPSLHLSADMGAIAQREPTSIEFRFENPPVLVGPKDAPARYQLQRLVEYSDFAAWTDVSRRLATVFAPASRLAQNSPLRAEVARIMAAHSDPAARAAAALELVQQDVRYVYVGLNRGSLTPASADETWQRRYGDCKAKTALLLALLGEMGIVAEPVLVNNSGLDDGLDSRLPSPTLFDHVLVRADLGSQRYWLDGTMPAVATASVEPILPYRWVLPLEPQGAALEPIAWHPAREPDQITLFDIDARAGFDQPAAVTNRVITRGVTGLLQQMQFSALTPDQLLAGMRQQLVGSGWLSVDAVQWRYDAKARASITEIRGSWTLDWDNDGGDARSLALPGGGFSPPERRGRPADQDQNLPFAVKPEFDCRVTTVRLPKATRPIAWSSKGGYDTRLFGVNYYRALQIREGAARLVRGLRVERNEIDAATARQDNARIAKFDNSMAWIYYDPTQPAGADLTARPVPTADEIDWTAPDAPCLAKETPR